MRKGGARISVEFAILPFHDESGHMVGIAAILRDVTKRFEEMRALRKELTVRQEALAASTHYRWTLSRDSMRHARHSGSDPDCSDGGERVELESVARSSKTEHRLRQRSRIVLPAAAGTATRAIAREVGCMIGTASKWRERYGALCRQSLGRPR